MFVRFMNQYPRSDRASDCESIDASILRASPLQGLIDWQKVGGYTKDHRTTPETKVSPALFEGTGWGLLSQGVASTL